MAIKRLLKNVRQERFIKIAVLLFCVIAFVCGSLLLKTNKSASVFDEKEFEIYKSWYDEIVKEFEQDSITHIDTMDNIKSEYRVIIDVSLLHCRFYLLQIHKNGTGCFHNMVCKFEDGAIVHEQKALTKREVRSLENVIAACDYFNVPISDGSIGVDGVSYFVEGYTKNKYHFARRWSPDREDEISKIAKAFYDFGQAS